MRLGILSGVLTVAALPLFVAAVVAPFGFVFVVALLADLLLIGGALEAGR